MNKNFQLYFQYEMAIFDVNEQSKFHDFIVADKTQLERSGEPLNKFKVC